MKETVPVPDRPGRWELSPGRLNRIAFLFLFLVTIPMLTKIF
ncbi:MAG: hypothetical protein H6Q84_100, partial [Deltaproteobacteria bacterium]|nr:hypothetical protein [Deltaproteobacteria bacterium]